MYQLSTLPADLDYVSIGTNRGVHVLPLDHLTRGVECEQLGILESTHSQVVLFGWAMTHGEDRKGYRGRGQTLSKVTKMEKEITR